MLEYGKKVGKMIRNYLYTLLLMWISMSVLGQTTATDFTADDCDGITHHLFEELDAGKVVVIDWVMPCGPCIGPSLAAYTAVESFSDSHPGRVLFYTVDDFADTPCNTLVAWSQTNGLPTTNVFSTSIIDMYAYGAYGMPKVVVLGGGTEHKVYYNENFIVDGNEVKDAITEALAVSSLAEKAVPDLGLEVFPNPANEKIQVSFQLPRSSQISVDVFSMLGTVQRMPLADIIAPAGMQQVDVDVSGLNNGVYILSVNTEVGFQTTRFSIFR